MQQLKKIAFLVPKHGMDIASFTRYWRGTHGPLVAGSPNYGEWRRRYAQNHVLEPGPIGRTFPYAGMAEFWLPGEAVNEDRFSASAIYQNRIRPDEERFIDMDRTVSMAAKETILKEGKAPVKLVVLSSRAQACPPGAFSELFLESYVPAISGDPEISGRISAWTADFVIAGSFRLPGARAADALPVDCVEAYRFRKRDDAFAVFRAMEQSRAISGIRAQLFDGDAGSSFLAEEIAFYDNGPLLGETPH